MLKTVKRLILIPVVLLVLLLVLLFVGFFYIDSIAKAAVEKGGTYALGVPTKLGEANVGVFSGGFEMKNLDVGNPQGFKSPSFMTLGDGGIKVALSTLRKETVEVPKLALSDIQLNLEKSGGKSNYQVILDNLKKLESPQQQPAPKESGGKKFVIKEVDIRNVKVHVDMLPVGGSLTQVNLTLDQISLHDVGSGGQGVSLDALTSILIKALMAAIAEKGGGILPDDLVGDLKGQLAGLKGLGDMGVKLTSGAAQDVGKAVEGATKDLGKKVEEGLKGILPGDKKK